MMNAKIIMLAVIAIVYGALIVVAISPATNDERDD